MRGIVRNFNYFDGWPQGFRVTRLRRSLLVLGLVACASGASDEPVSEAEPFHLEEATIPGLHAAIQSGQTTCVDVIQEYIDRAKAYNGVCTALITEDGAPIPEATGAVRAGSPLKFPTQTVAASTILPDLDQYAGLPMEFGRMEPTISDPSVMQQWGMRVGIPNAGQLNALETLNIRGERSVTCKAQCDTHPSAGALPENCPAACEDFRKHPDALERAAELDRQYGKNPDLEKLPMYCVAFSHKHWYDSVDMRSTGGNDVNYAVDFGHADSPDIRVLREKGAIIYGVATAAPTGLSMPGPHRANTYSVPGNYGYAPWGGQPCNPYDTERVPRGTSGGSGVSVAANLVHCSICEQGNASCKGPASRNNVVNFLTTKGLLMHGGMNSQRAGDRAGIHCRTVKDAVLVLDAVKGFKSDDMYTALPERLIPDEPYASFVVTEDQVEDKPLAGMRVALVREFMVKHSKNDVAISDQIDNEIKSILRDKLGAELVESYDPLYPNDLTVPTMKYTFQDAIAEILFHHVPDYFRQVDSNGELEFAVPGHDVTSLEYAISLALGEAPLSDRLSLRRISSGLDNFKSPFTVNKYLRERGDERVYNWETFFENAKYVDDNQRAGWQNAIGANDIRRSTVRPDAMSYLEMRKVLQLVVQKVMLENNIDAFVNPEVTLPPYRVGGPTEPTVMNRGTHSCCGAFTALLGGPEIEVPAGYNQVVYEPQYQLSAGKTRYISVAGEERSLLPVPMPISLMVWGGPGSEPEVIKVASAYEAATGHRKPPPDFGPLKAAK